MVFMFSVVLLGSCKKYPEGSLISLSSPEKRIKRNWSLNQDSIRRFIFQEENILKYYSSQNILSELYWKFYDKKRKLILSVNDDFTLHNDTLIIINLSNKNTIFVCRLFISNLFTLQNSKNKSCRLCFDIYLILSITALAH